jgi:hypothetical protein
MAALVVGTFAGVFVDRRDRRRTMMTADAARAALITGLLLLPSAGRARPAGVQVGVIYAAVAASCFAQFFNPSRLAILGTWWIPPTGREPANIRITGAWLRVPDLRRLVTALVGWAAETSCGGRGGSCGECLRGVAGWRVTGAVRDGAFSGRVPEGCQWPGANAWRHRIRCSDRRNLMQG